MLAVFHLRGNIPTFMVDYLNTSVSIGSFVKRLKNKCTKNHFIESCLMDVFFFFSTKRYH